MRIDKIAQMLEALQDLYNHHRPHAALAEIPQPSTSLSAEPPNSPVSYVLSQDSSLTFGVAPSI